MLEYNEITERKYIVFEGEPYEVLSSHVFRKQQRKPVNATKLRNLLTGRIVEHSFHVSDKAEEADISKREVKYLYTNKGEYWFSEVNDPSERFELPESMIGTAAKFLKENTVVDALIFDDGKSDEGKIIGLKLPIKMDLKVVEAHPAVKGNTAQGGSKIVKLETGAELQVPMFIKEGDIVRVNTDTGDYTDRIGGANF
jgi:elongation factor P